MQDLLFILENTDKIWYNLMHLKKSVMGMQVRAFKSCNDDNDKD